MIDATSEYEAKRRERIRENAAAMNNLGILRQDISNDTYEERIARMKAAKAKARIKRKLAEEADENDESKIKIEPRTSRRLRGIEPETPAGIQKDFKPLPLDMDSDGEEDDTPDLIRRWKEEMRKNARSSESNGSSSPNGQLPDLETNESTQRPTSERRRLFLVPTGVPGANDHTLDEPVSAYNNEFLWGFCEGLLARIFFHIRPGDIFLMTSAGSGEFDRLARVKSKAIVNKQDADKFWTRISFSMGGGCKANIGFPLLCPLHKPLKLSWNKREAMKLLGYNDHLQSSRRVSDAKLESTGGRILYKRCLDELGLPEYLYQEEIDEEKRVLVRDRKSVV